MSYKSVLNQILSWTPGNTPQSMPLPGQVPNAGGGYVYQISDWDRLDRFLILGSEAGSYYVTPTALTIENSQVVQKLLLADGLKVVDRIVEISVSGRAPKPDSGLFALALAASLAPDNVRAAALAALPKVARTGTHLLHFAAYVNGMRGWGRGLRRAIGAWFTAMPAEKLALQAVKYSQRDGWSLRDLLRLSHPFPDDATQRAVLDWIAHPDKPEAIANARALTVIDGKYKAKEALTPAEIAALIRLHNLPREAVPTEALNALEVWAALFEAMPMMAMIRNLGKMSAIGLLTPFAAETERACARLRDSAALTAARIGPFSLLLALRTYAAGAGALGKLTWTPAPALVAALDDAFDLSFKAVTPSGKRILVGIDVSGSMNNMLCVGSPVLRPIEAAAAVASFLVRTEPFIHTIAFDTETHEFPITPSQRLDDIVASITKWGGGTDVALPVQYALNRKMAVDAFIILTDGETWAGRRHAVEALAEYRARINPAAKLVVMATSATHSGIVDEADPLSFGVAGFDAAAPQLAMDFIAGTAAAGVINEDSAD